MTASALTHRIRCGNPNSPDLPGPHTHATAAEVASCYAATRAYAEYCDWDDGAAAAEQAYERHLENRGYGEARAQADYEARNGVVGFIEAWHLASPDTCPCCN